MIGEGSPLPENRARVRGRRGLEAESLPESRSGSGPDIAFVGVSKWFRRSDGLVHALSGITLEVGESEFVSLIGPSGCGKSTLLRLAGGLLDPDRGSISLGGRPPSEARRLKGYGFVPQHPALLPWRTVRGNVGLLGDVNRGAGRLGMSGEELERMLNAIGLSTFLEALPHELSGGMQQRVSIARAFALGAPVLLMDEPFASLDEITRTGMRYLLLDMWRRIGSTVLFVTHSISEAVILSDRVVVLGQRPGRITRIVDVPLPRPRRVGMEDDEDCRRVIVEVRSALNQG